MRGRSYGPSATSVEAGVQEWRRVHVNMCSDGVTCECRRVARGKEKKVQSKRCVVGAAWLRKFIFCINAAGHSGASWENKN